ncbi:PTS transporter subunit EIIC [Listeria sp. FSL L7-1485]|uniref:PTS transporter subunit EIIC n=1 Tax=Listeria immobilis TaxID=2713502 RepID=A0A7X0X9S4_9LIST|nr:beta-glucoside-specific PTS transporter subunit IIABC [Listeria immobilis]MBC1483167.1 PTS transporter subunit EIIC [Listeria immobilis]MBC1489988.1 PTS transporter subunit EIIC [Listeria immobilis]MBC1505979.1 PTS transporter subunit EIIC [Listeria immobilis]MBC1508623.1 PTS transporter subunit EIIC [Listeria immobilis]MBC1516659.1 PTS transporter subunit EIIC [Listeria immobilis]
MDYKQVASSVLENIGGEKNILHMEHCSTRLRFTLKNYDQVNVSELEKIDGVIGVKQNVQCQVIIGNEVVEVYDELMKLTGPIDNNTKSPSEKRKIGAIFLDFLVSIFQPLVPAIAGGGILKSILMLLAIMGVMNEQSPTYQILNLIGGAPLYFLPILVAMTTANKLKVNPLVAVSAVGALLLPDMAALLAKGTTLFTFQIENISYAFQVFPAILTVLLYSQVEKFFTKYSLKSIRIFFVPMMSLVVTVPISLLILGPFGYYVGTIFSSIIVSFYEQFGWVATGLLAAILPLMVLTGMHKALLPYAITTMGNLGAEMLYLPASLAHNIAESGACFAVGIKTKNKELRATSVSAGISALFGITEPALYGVTILHKKVLYSVMAASMIGGAFAGAVALKAFALVGPGLASITMFADKTNPMNLVWAFVTLGLSFVLGFIFVLVLYKDPTEKVKTERSNGEDLDSIYSLKTPVEGQVIPMSQIKDDIFSSGMIGDGLGIIPSSGTLFSPCSGEITMVFDTKHAIGMRLDNGADLLFHLGIDTVKMEGNGFDTLVKVGDRVKQGDPLIRFNLTEIERFGLDPTVIFLVTNQTNFSIVKFKEGELAGKDDIIMEIESN